MEKYKAKIIQYGNIGIQFLQVHAVILFIVIFAGLTGYLVMKTGELIASEPTDIQITEKKAEVKRVKIDEKSLQVVNELTSRNINLESLFVERDNPFEN